MLKMDCTWIKSSPSLKKGIDIINLLEDTKFEQFLKRIVVKLKLQDLEIFSEDEKKKLEKIFKINDEQLLLAIKTIIYIFKRILKYIFMPANLANDLKMLGFNTEKTALLIKLWSTETSATLNDLASSNKSKCDENPDFNWKLNTELSSDYQRKCKIPKAYIKFTGEQESEVELTHDEIYSLFLQIESIQNELDNLM